jgi:tungstate transport system substrate-binding protein
MHRATLRLLGASLLTLAAVAALAAGPARAAEPRLRLATTTSTENSGLLKALLPVFEQRCGCKVDVIAVGTGKALKLGERGDVDVVLVHARALEDKFVAEGFGVDRRDVMYNDFIVLGPKADPARVKGAPDAPAAFKKIAEAKAPFISRGDQSGTHEKEKELWKTAAVTPAAPWYREAGQGMSEVITMAGEQQGYTLADRGTYLAMRKKSPLVVLAQGDRTLFNPYGVILVNPEKHPHVQKALALSFMDFLTGPEGQKLIGDFKVDGDPLFFPDALPKH